MPPSPPVRVYSREKLHYCHILYYILLRRASDSYLLRYALFTLTLRRVYTVYMYHQHTDTRTHTHTRLCHPRAGCNYARECVLWQARQVAYGQNWRNLLFHNTGLQLAQHGLNLINSLVKTVYRAVVVLGCLNFTTNKIVLLFFHFLYYFVFFCQTNK